MQNRESAIRSRTRKKSHVDTIETILSDINSKNKYLSCENDALNNENAFLKKRLSYFEELFKVKAEKEKTNEQTPLPKSSQASSVCGDQDHSALDPIDWEERDKTDFFMPFNKNDSLVGLFDIETQEEQ